MFEFVEQLPDGILKSLLQIVALLFSTCSTIFEYGGNSLQEIIVEIMGNLDFPQSFIDAVNAVLSGPWAFIYHISLFEILLGGALFAVVIFGIIKYFTDIVL